MKTFIYIGTKDKDYQLRVYNNHHIPVNTNLKTHIDTYEEIIDNFLKCQIIYVHI